jgi:hypothetical protein
MKNFGRRLERIETRIERGNVKSEEEMPEILGDGIGENDLFFEDNGNENEMPEILGDGIGEKERV